MTNDIEYLIIKDKKTTEKLEYKKNIAYRFYEEIWKFILYSLKYDYEFLSIHFNVINNKDSYYINKNNGIKYKIEGDDISSTWNTYYETSEHFYINTIFNTSIDIDLLYKLFDCDNIKYKVIKDGNNNYVNTLLKKDKILDIVDSTLIKNKILTKNYRG